MSRIILIKPGHKTIERYYQVLQGYSEHHVKHEGGDPSELLIRDRPLLVAVALWAVSVGLILYFAR